MSEKNGSCFLGALPVDSAQKQIQQNLRRSQVEKPSAAEKKKNACVHRKFASQKPSTSNDVIEHNNKYHLIIGPPPQVRSKATRGIFHQDVFQGSFSLKQESKHVVIIIHWKYVEFMYVHYRYCIWYTC